METENNLKFFLVLALLFILPITPVFAEENDCLEASLQGGLDAQNYHKAAGWFVLGLPAILIGPVGLVGIPLIAYASSPSPKTFPEETTNFACYFEGYRKKARRKNGGAALGGAAIGTTAAFIFVFFWFGGYF